MSRFHVFATLLAASLFQSLPAAITLDSGFSPNLPAPSASGPNYDLNLAASDGSFYIHDTETEAVSRISSGGLLDPTFSPVVSGYGLQLSEEAGVLVAGGIFKLNGQDTLLTRLQQNGAVMPGFSPVASPGTNIYGSEFFVTRNGGHYIINHSLGVIAVARTTGEVVSGFPAAATTMLHKQDNSGRFIATQETGTSQTIVRYMEDFTADAGFSAPVFQRQGSYMYLGVNQVGSGYMLRVDGSGLLNGQPAAHFYRLDAAGGLSAGFTPVTIPNISGAEPEVITFLDACELTGRFLVSSSHYLGLGGFKDSFRAFSTDTGVAINTDFNPLLACNISGYRHGECLETGGYSIGIDDCSEIGGAPVPLGACQAVYNESGGLVRIDGALPPIQYWDAESASLRSVNWVTAEKLSDGTRLITNSDPGFTHVNGQPASGLLVFDPAGNWDAASVLVPGFPSDLAEWRRRVGVHELPGRKVLLTGSFTSVNGLPRPGVALLRLPAGVHPEWTTLYNLPTNVATLAASDTDGDGLPDLVELAFGLHPRQADVGGMGAGKPAGLPAATTSGTGSARRMELRYLRRRDRAALGLTYTPLFYSELGAAGVEGTEISALAHDATWEVVTVRDTASPTGATKRFGRVRVGL